MDWTCEVCGGKSFVRVDEKKPDGSFGSGPDVRCVECKTVARNPTLPNANELEVVAWRWPEPQREGGFLHSVTNVEPPCSGWEALVTLSSAQARIDRLTDMLDGYGKLDAEYAIMERRAEAAEAEVKRLREALEPFADFGEFMEAETEGFSETDRLELVPEQSDVRIGDLFVGSFRRARAALTAKGGQ